ncbi:hypothetical protein OSB04_027754 [Centaurea solstitialis]|uniref:SWIM-type domain-containing protein n=1 Tax=Centaurea solstitialis TaxID=347529 RepID=A0AA38SLV5_9ASTR|nr:hypothetical protein OSB04_027754 [Centaurea solstitialis]
MWEVRTFHEDDQSDEYRDVYDAYEELVALKIHHGGRFTKFPDRRYERGKVHIVDLVDTEKFSVHELEEMMKELGYKSPRPTYYHFVVPGKDLDYGLHALGSDMDVIEMLKFVGKCKVFEIYTEHWVSRVNTYDLSPGVSKVVIEQLPDEPPPAKRRLMLEWKDEESDVPKDVNDVGSKQPTDQVDVNDVASKQPTDQVDVNDVANNEPTDEVDVNDVASKEDVGKKPVDIDYLDGIDISVFDDDFDPFFGAAMEKETDVVDNVSEIDGSDTDESDFEVELQNVVEEVDVDMKQFKGNTDFGVEWFEKSEVVVEKGNVPGDVNVVEMDVMDSSTDESDLEAERKALLRKLRKEKSACDDKEETVSFYVGQVFGSKEDMNMEYGGGACGKGVKVGSSGNQKKMGSTGKQKKVGSSGHVCPWVLYISKTKADDTWMVKTFVDTHECLQSMKVKACTASFLAKQIMETVSHNPEIPIKAIQLEMQRTYGQKFSHMKAFRAKTMALEKIRGSFGEQYNRLRDYAAELQRTNPNTTVKLDVENEGSSESIRFKRIYICFGALKKGFKAAKRDFLGLDGAFMKGPFPGQILTAVGLDSNNATYPVAYAIVEAETKNSWTWFLELLGDDLDLTTRSNFTFISDRQKGIIPAIAKVFPSAEHRFCVRHIHDNMKVFGRGKDLKDQVWICAAAATVPEFEQAMKTLKSMSSQAYEWLKQIPLHHWSRAHFTGRSHTDCLLNNICETFNNQLVDARDKPIITCLEYIREYLMKRIGNVNMVIQKSVGPLTPTAARVLESIKKQAMHLTVIWGGGTSYQVDGPWGDKCGVDMKDKTCSCRTWELIGIPCKHAVACIWNMASNGAEVGIPELWVHEVYWLDTWKKMYSFHLQPINGPKMWPKVDYPLKVIPPTHHKPVGRPKKKRQKSIAEITEGNKLKRVGKTVRCVKCNQEGHNKRTCKGQAP